MILILLSTASLALTMPGEAAAELPYEYRDETLILVADFEGPGEPGSNPGTWILDYMNSIAADYANVRIVQLDRTLSPGDPEAEALGLLETEDAAMIVWGYFEPHGAYHVVYPCYATPFGVFAAGEPLPESVMWDYEALGLDHSFLSYMDDLPGLEYGTSVDVSTASVWMAMAQAYLGIALSTSGRLDQGQQLLEEAANSSHEGWRGSQGHMISLANAGLFASCMGHPERTVDCFSQMLEWDPDLPVAYRNRGLALYSMGQYEPAIQDFTRMIELEPDGAEAYYMRGMADCRNGMQMLGIQDFDACLEMDPDDALALGNRGYAYYELGMYEEAIRDLSLAAELEGEHGTARNLANLAFTYQGLGLYSEAIESFTAAIEKADDHPTIAEMLYNRGNCYCFLGDIERGIEDFSACLEHEPDRASAYLIRGRARFFMNEFEEALTDLNAAIELDPDWTPSYYWRGRVRGGLGDINGAKEDLNYAMENTEDPETYNLSLAALRNLRN